MARKKSPERKLIEAVESGQNLLISKALREVLANELLNKELEPRERVQFISNLNKVNSDIIKLEGQKSEEEEDEDLGPSVDDLFAGGK